MKQVSRIGITLLAFAATGIVAGCASVPLSTEVSTPTIIIRAAEEAGAATVPQASLYLQLAKEEVESARTLSAQGNMEEARSMLTRAEADAELALTLSLKDTEKSEAIEAVERVRKLRKDNL